MVEGGSEVALPPDTRLLIELVLERLNMSAGQWLLEVQADDGRVNHIRRHERVAATALARFNP